MDSYDYLTSDHIGRDVEVRSTIFTTERTTIYGGGSRETTTTLG